MSRAFEVLCVGVATIDTIAVVDRVPGSDERAVSDPFVVAGGGPAATAAVALARLGVPVAFCGVVGDDEGGRLARASLESEGVDTRWLRSDPAVHTARSVVLVERGSGARTIVTMAQPAPAAAEIPVDAAEWVHVDQVGYAPAREAVAGAPDASRPRLSVDAGNAVDGLRLDGISLYAPTAAALLQRFPGRDVSDALQAAADEGAELVLATAGADGSHVLVDGEVVHVPGVPIEAVSTLGAGDVFHGSVLAGLVRGMDLAGAAAFAGLVAALSCRALDGRSGIPDAAEVERVRQTRTGQAV